MKNRIIALILGTAVIGATAMAQDSQLPAPPAIEKQLAARASNVTEVTLGKNMLGFASKVMNNKDKDGAATRHLIEGLDGIYVREYDFDKEGQFTSDEVDQLRKYFETSEWTPMVHERDRKNNESTDVMVKLVNGESHGMFILDVEPKELTIVLILGPIHMDELGQLNGLAGLGALGSIGGMEHSPRGKGDVVKEKDKAKAMDKDKSGGNQ